MSIIPAESYQGVYLLIIALLSIVSILNFHVDITKKSDFGVSLVICTILVLFLGTRPISEYFADMPLYYGLYNSWRGSFSFDVHAVNFLFDNLESFLASVQFDPTLHYVLFAGIYYGGILVACKKLFPGHITFAFLCYCAAFSTFSYCVNGYKAGSAAAFFLIALAYRDNIKVAIPFALISWGFHHSMQLPIVAFFITYFYHKPGNYLVLWLICAIISILHITTFQEFFAGITDEQGSGYLDPARRITNVQGVKLGFRYDFWIYSAVPVLVGYWVKFKLRLKDDFYDKLLCFYLLTNSVWLLCVYANFTNRIAYLSWFVYPIVLVYPLFNEALGETRTRYIKLTVSLHLAFTLFMSIIYYG